MGLPEKANKRSAWIEARKQEFSGEEEREGGSRSLELVLLKGKLFKEGKYEAFWILKMDWK